MQWACAVLHCHLRSVRIYIIFPHYLIIGTISRIILPDPERVFWFSQPHSSVTFIILSIERDMIKMYICLHVMYPLIMSHFNETFTFSTDFRNLLKNIKFHENSTSGSLTVPRGLTGRRADMMKIIVAFRNFVNAPKNYEIAEYKSFHYNFLLASSCSYRALR
jgi:hypothetical protein